MNSILKWSAASLLICAGTQSPAFASRSIFYPSTSSDLHFSLHLNQDLNVLVDGKPQTLKPDGLLLAPGIDPSQISEGDLQKLRIKALEISASDDSENSFLGLKTEGGLFGMGSSEIKFNLGTHVEIDPNGNPIGIDGIKASAQTTGQGVGVQIRNTSPGAWIPYDTAYDAECSYQVCHTECTHHFEGLNGGGHNGGGHNGGGHDECHVECYVHYGMQWIHNWGQTKTDGYTVSFDTLGAGQFNLDYSIHNHMEGICR